MNASHKLSNDIIISMTELNPFDSYIYGMKYII